MLLHGEIVLIVEKLLFIIVKESLVIRKYCFLLRDRKNFLLVKANYIKCNI